MTARPLATGADDTWSRSMRMGPATAFPYSRTQAGQWPVYAVTLHGRPMLSDAAVVVDVDLVRTSSWVMPPVIDAEPLTTLTVWDAPTVGVLAVPEARLPLLRHLNTLGRVGLHQTSLGERALGLSVAGLLVGAIARPTHIENPHQVVVVDGQFRRWVELGGGPAAAVLT